MDPTLLFLLHSPYHADAGNFLYCAFDSRQQIKLIWMSKEMVRMDLEMLYLGNKMILLPAAGIYRRIMAKAEGLSEKWIVGREAKLRGQLWNFEDPRNNFTRRTHVDRSYIYWGFFFVFLCAELSTSFF